MIEPVPVTLTEVDVPAEEGDTGPTKSERLEAWLMEQPDERLKLSGAKIVELSGVDMGVTQANVVKRRLREKLGMTP